MPDIFNLPVPQDKTVVVKCVNPFSVGTFASLESPATGESGGINLSSTQTKAFDVLADDGGVALSATSYCASRNRMLLTKTVAGANMSAAGAKDHAKIAGIAFSCGAHVNGTYGYLETVSGTSLDGGIFAGVRGEVDLPTGATIGAGVYLSAFCASSSDLSGTHTGKAVAFEVTDPVDGDWDAAFRFASGGGISTQAGGTLTITKKIAIYDDAGNLIYIPAGTIA
jgi:hypothetical protein